MGRWSYFALAVEPAGLVCAWLALVDECPCSCTGNRITGDELDDAGAAELDVGPGNFFVSTSALVAAPEELFLWEFESVVVANAHGDVVIGFDAADSAPKE